MSFKMANFDRFLGHRLEDEGARKRESINLSIEKHPKNSDGTQELASRLR